MERDRTAGDQLMARTDQPTATALVRDGVFIAFAQTHRHWKTPDNVDIAPQALSDPARSPARRELLAAHHLYPVAGWQRPATPWTRVTGFDARFDADSQIVAVTWQTEDDLAAWQTAMIARVEGHFAQLAGKTNPLQWMSDMRRLAKLEKIYDLATVRAKDPRDLDGNEYDLLRLSELDEWHDQAHYRSRELIYEIQTATEVTEIDVTADWPPFPTV